MFCIDRSAIILWPPGQYLASLRHFIKSLLTNQDMNKEFVWGARNIFVTCEFKGWIRVASNRCHQDHFWGIWRVWQRLFDIIISSFCRASAVLLNDTTVVECCCYKGDRWGIKLYICCYALFPLDNMRFCAQIIFVQWQEQVGCSNFRIVSLLFHTSKWKLPAELKQHKGTLGIFGS